MSGILLNGCNGKMGAATTAYAAETKACEIVGGVDISTERRASYPVFSSPSLVSEDVIGRTDAIIDFSNPSALSGLLEFAVARSVPCVIATTGLDDAQIELIKAASAKIPAFYSRNMSLGINLLCELAKKAAEVLGDSFDIEIIEAHHNQKIDAPSGTALALADSINSVLGDKMKYEYDRRSKRGRRTKNEIGIHSVRGGTITGEHEVIFAGEDEIIRLSHSAGSKKLFAAGAVGAAKFLAGKPAGLYGMSDMLNSRGGQK